MSQITMSSTYESNTMELHMSQIDMSTHMSQITMSIHMSQIDMSSTSESNYYE